MKTGDPEAAKDLVRWLKSCLEQEGLKIGVLDAPGKDTIRKKLDRLNQEGHGGVLPNPENMDAIADAVWNFAHPAKPDSDPRQREKVSRFWSAFTGKWAELAGHELPVLNRVEDVRQAFRGIVFPDGPRNPFTWRAAITLRRAFFGRENELRRLRDFVANKQNVQLVGPRRIGKSSLLRAVGHRVRDWLEQPAFAFVDMEKASCHTQSGWLRRVAAEWYWPDPPDSLGAFSERVDADLQAGRRLVLAVDEFEKFADLREEFPADFFENLRACGQEGVSILTAARMTLREIRRSGALLSPYYNTFSTLEVEPFTMREATTFVHLARPRLEPFSGAETEGILAFGEAHPLKLQLGCYEVIEAREEGRAVPAAIQRAMRQAAEMLPSAG